MVNGMCVELFILNRMKNYLDNGFNFVILCYEINDIVILEIDV